PMEVELPNCRRRADRVFFRRILMDRMRSALIFLPALFFTAASTVLAVDDPVTLPVSIRVDASRTLGPLHPVWRFFGADEPNYACLPNGRKLIGELGLLSPGRVYFRAHNLLTSGDGTPALKWGSTGLYSEDGKGNPVYNWTILDRIFGVYLNSGVKPYVEI